MTTLYNHFGGWAEALAAANITDAELAAARSARLPGGGAVKVDVGPAPATGLAALCAEDLVAAGLSEAERTRLVGRGAKGFMALPMSRSAALAHALGGSLDWLAGVDAVQGEAALASARFDGAAFNQLRKARRVREEAVLTRAHLSLGLYRAILKGTREPTLGQAVTLAGLVRSPVVTLLREMRSGDD